MANIGIVYKDSYTKENKIYPLIVLDIRTVSIKKEFTILINKHKYIDGKIDGVVAQGKENHPDYHIWCNLAKRGESGRSEIVGSVRDAVSDNGLKYKRAQIFDPFISKENIYFTLFSVDADKKKNANHLYNVVAQPYRQINSAQQSEQAQPNYEPQASYAPQENSTKQDIDEDGEIPF